MNFFRQLRALFRKEKLDAEMSEEMRAHLEMEAARNRAAGMSTDEARYAAQRQFGGVEQFKERARDDRSLLWLEQTRQDIRYAFRQLTKARGFTAIVVLTLGLGIGANTAVFSVVRDVFLRALPVKDPDELVLFDSFTPPNAPRCAGESFGAPTFSLLTFERMRDHNETLSALFAFAPLFDLLVAVDGVAEAESDGLLVTGDYFRGLGVSPALGRSLTPDDDRSDAPPVAIISHHYWQRRFASKPSVVGTTIVVNHTLVTIIGVTAPGFAGMRRSGHGPDLTFPLRMVTSLRADSPMLFRQPGGYWWVSIIGRPKASISPEQVRRSFAGIFGESASEGLLALGRLSVAPDGSPRDLPELRVEPGREGMERARWEDERTLLIMIGLVGLALLIACINVGNLLLARGATQRREIAVRLAMGAGRSRLIRQLLTESVLLAVLGGACGVLFAAWGNALLGQSSPLDLPMLGFTSAVSVLTGLVFGLTPALRATRLNLTAEFQGGGRNTHGDGTLRLGRLLMIAQVALSVVVLAGAGLMLRTLHNLRGVELGINGEQLLLFSVDAAAAGYRPEQFLALQARVAARIEAAPGVDSASFSRVPWLSGRRHQQYVAVQEPVPPPQKPFEAAIHAVAPGFFATMGMPILVGRDFTERDGERAPKVALINQSMAREIFGGRNPVSRRFGLGGPEQASEIEIVGVVRDAGDSAVRLGIPSLVFLSIAQAPASKTGGNRGTAHFVVRTRTDAAALAGVVRDAVRSIDGNLALTRMRTQEDELERSLREERLLARFATFFGLLALGLACVGLYGLMSHAVQRRTSEIGVRMALGAQPRGVLWMMLRESLVLVGAGVIVGFGAAAAATRLIATLLYDLSPTDPATYVGVASLLMMVACAAALMPAWRAAKIDPMVALRAE